MLFITLYSSRQQLFQTLQEFSPIPTKKTLHKECNITLLPRNLSQASALHHPADVTSGERVE